MRSRDRAAAATLRAALAAVDNAEAVPLDAAGPGARAGAVELSAVGVRAAEVSRRTLSENEIRAVVRSEVDELRRAAQEVHAADADRAAGHTAAAELLEALLAVARH